MTTSLLPAPTRPTKPVRVKKARGNKYASEKVGTPLTVPQMVTVFNPSTQKEVKHYGYEALVQHQSKPNEVRTILCSRLDYVRIGEPVAVVYHHGMKAYKHSRYVPVSNSNNCSGGFYYINGAKA